MGRIYYFYIKTAITMMRGGWSNGEVTDEIKEICKHEKVLGALSTSLGQEAGSINFEPSSVEKQVVSGMNYRITGSHGNGNATILVWHQAWKGGIQSVKVENMTC